MKWKKYNLNYKDNIESLRAKTPYELLGVSETSTKKEIKRAFLNRIKLYHPDGRDPFMIKYCEEVAKLLNSAMEQILKEGR